MIIYYDRIPDDKFMVYDVWFAGLDGILAEVKRRLDLLETGADHAELPACRHGWPSIAASRRSVDAEPASGEGRQ